MNSKLPLLLLLLVFAGTSKCQQLQLITAKLKPVFNTNASYDRGKVLYKMECMSCHQASGEGVAYINPAITNNAVVQGAKDKLINLVLNGIYSQTKDVQNGYTNNMPGHHYLSNQQIADLLTFLRQNFGNKAEPVFANEVASVRLISSDKKTKRK
ncbi:MAG: c-type cytochrome [Chitinophagaceae bacterium]